MKNIFKILITVLSLSLVLSLLASCNLIFPSDDTKDPHTCESKCETCGKCEDESCTEDACKDKCPGHEVVPPAHTCESKCETCGKCEDESCTEDACKDKCSGHDGEITYTNYTYKLNLMSFNIRTIASESNSVNNWDSRKAAVANFINTCGADIIGLQEVRQSQFNYINSNLASNYDALYFPREGGSNPEGLAFVYDSTKFKFVSTEKYWLSATPDVQSLGWSEEYYRIAAILILEHIETGELVKSINTHGPLDDPSNVNAYKLIMERSVNEDDCFTFLCGDFNATPGILGYAEVAKELKDCRIEAAESSARDHLTYTGWSEFDDPMKVSNIIDYCFVTDSENVDVLTYEVRNDRWGNNNMLSDHYAIQTTVEITYKTDINKPGQTGGGFDGEIDPAN